MTTRHTHVHNVTFFHYVNTKTKPPITLVRGKFVINHRARRGITRGNTPVRGVCRCCGCGRTDVLAVVHGAGLQVVADVIHDEVRGNVAQPPAPTVSAQSLQKYSEGRVRRTMWADFVHASSHWMAVSRWGSGRDGETIGVRQKRRQQWWRLGAF